MKMKINKYCGTLNISNVIKITDNEDVSELTPLETWLLMGFDNKSFNKLEKKEISKGNLYKLVGNSIVVK